MPLRERRQLYFARHRDAAGFSPCVSARFNDMKRKAIPMTIINLGPRTRGSVTVLSGDFYLGTAMPNDAKSRKARHDDFLKAIVPNFSTQPKKQDNYQISESSPYGMSIFNGHNSLHDHEFPPLRMAFEFVSAALETLGLLDHQFLINTKHFSTEFTALVAQPYTPTDLMTEKLERISPLLADMGMAATILPRSASPHYPDGCSVFIITLEPNDKTKRAVTMGAAMLFYSSLGRVIRIGSGGRPWIARFNSDPEDNVAGGAFLAEVVGASIDPARLVREAKEYVATTDDPWGENWYLADLKEGLDAPAPQKAMTFDLSSPIVVAGM
jgi:hypothetical protein